ncbi:MAG: ECF transporter S component [Atribacterota bacterium]
MHQKTLSFPLSRITFTASLVALSVVGSYLKIPSPTGTVALDSLPGFVGALVLGYPEGALIAFLGHILTSMNVGFPLGVLVHLIIAAEMAGIAVSFRFSVKPGKYALGVVVGTILNGIIAPLTLVPLFGWGFFSGIVVSLLVASAVNLILACVIHRILTKR